MHLFAFKMLQLSPHVFANMRRLQFLDFHCEYNEGCMDVFPQGIPSLPSELRYLRWTNFPLKSLPKDFLTKKLVILDLSYSQVEKLWHEVQNLVNSKEVELHGSTFLKDISNIRDDDFRLCDQLTNVYPSILSLDKLEKLDLNHTLLTILTRATYLSTLSYLDFGFCHIELGYMDTIEFDSYFGLQSNLQILHLRGSGVESLPLSIKNLRRLRYLDVSYCRGLQTLPQLPPSLEALLATECSSLKTVLFPSVAEQFEEDRKRVEFWNCFILDEPSVAAIELNAQINVKKFAFQHLSALEHSNAEYYNDYNYYYDSYQATYLYPGRRVPEWLDYKTTEDYILIDLSSTPRSSPLGFVFCFIVGEDPLIGLGLKFILSISDDEGEGNEENIEIYMSREFVK
ncbi:hypothetical protein VNO77_07398 [Canavalia gladiata]|uniref:Uncharacterized protein n=1 Tax=Canavalia gladiata TaxID=3824 RepID=A0AAN9QWL7_CANGL